jgi:uncharacterized membrane-anchored protein
MSRPARRTARFLLIALLLTSLVASTKAEEAATEQPNAEAAAQAAAAEPVAEPEPIVINCQAAELIEPLTTWSVDCTAQWLENLGFGTCAFREVGDTVVGDCPRGLVLV